MRTRTIVLLAGASATLIAGAFIGRGLAGATTDATPVATAIATVMDTSAPLASAGAAVQADGTVAVPTADAHDGLTFTTPDHVTVRLTPPTGRTLALGLYSDVTGSATSTHGGMRITRGATHLDPVAGEFDVLDLRTDPSGTITSIDVVFRSGIANDVATTFGEFRMGQDDPAVRLSADHVAFPTTPVDGTRIWLEESVRNTSGSVVAIGTPTVSAGATKDYTVAANGCTGRLAAGASCTFRVGFSPTAAGPRNSTLTVPVGSGHRSVDLAGAAPLGETRITAAHDSWLRASHVTQANGPFVLQGPEGPGPGANSGTKWTYTWTVAEPYGGKGPGTTLSLSIPDGATTLPTGKHAVAELGDTSRIGMSFAVDGQSCGTVSGGIAPFATVKQFVTDENGALLRADVLWSTDCDDRRGTVEKGQLVWNVRDDVVAPEAVTGLRAATTDSVQWQQSASDDVAADVARLVPGDGAGATPTSGIGLGFGSSTTAALPSLVAGQQYTVVVFAVDDAGNTGTPATMQITG